MITEPPLVSVVLPVYNGEAFVREAIESVLAQTYQPLELVVVDDGSTDASASVVRSFPAVTYVGTENHGVAAARNTGVEAARGDFLAFIDQDDLWRPDKIEKQMQLLASDESIAYVVTEQRRFVDPSTERPLWVKPEWLTRTIQGLEPGALLVRRSIFERVGRFDGRYRQTSDSEWFFRATHLGVRHEVVREPLLLRRMHSSNSSRFIEQSASEFRRMAFESIRRHRQGTG